MKLQCRKKDVFVIPKNDTKLKLTGLYNMKTGKNNYSDLNTGGHNKTSFNLCIKPEFRSMK